MSGGLAIPSLSAASRSRDKGSFRKSRDNQLDNKI